MVAFPTMESFSLLKYWRGGAAAIRSSVAITADFAAAVLRPSSATAMDDDDGPFFDLEFTALTVGDGGRFNVEQRPVAGAPQTKSFPPIAASEADAKAQFPVVSLLRSATKFRVFLLGLRKPKPAVGEPDAAAAPPKQQESRFFVKFKVEEVPIVSLFTRDNSFRSISGCTAAKPPPEDSVSATAVAATSAQEKTLVGWEVLQKYVSMIKPVNVRIPRRPFEKVSLAEKPPATSRKEGGGCRVAGKGVPAGLKAVGKLLGKSRSSPAAAPPQRRNDSAQELDDVIQSAIAHCKRSFSAHNSPLLNLSP